MSQQNSTRLLIRPLYEVLVAAVNGNPVTADEAWALIHAWGEFRVALQDVQGIALNGTTETEDGTLTRLDAIDKRVSEALGA